MSLIAEAFVRLRPDTSTFRAEATAGLTSSLAGVGAGTLRASAGLIGVTSAATAGAIALRAIIVGAGELERELDVLQVVSGATADQMGAVGEEAKTLGADMTLPGISAGDAAVAMNELAKAGLSIKDVMSGAKGALQLATAGEIDVGQAAALAGGQLNVFGLAGDQATHVADLLAGASIAAQGEVSDMALALQQSGAVARQAGLSIEQTVGAIALLAKNGLLGSDAGTSLRTTLLRLVPTTKEAKQYTDALGISIDETRSLGEQLPEVIEQYRSALSHLNPVLQQQALTQIFGTDAIRAASIFAREGAAGYEEMTAAVDRSGAANELATARTKGLLGTLGNLKSQLETLAIEIGESVNPGIQGFAEDSATAVGAAIDLTRALKDLGDVKLPDWLDEGETIGGAISGAFGTIIDSAVPAIGAIKFLGEVTRDTSQEAADALSELRGGDIRAPDVIDIADASVAAKAAGVEVGGIFDNGLAKGITDQASLAVESARATLAQVVAEGKRAVEASIAEAQQNLASLGSTLAADAGTIIDAGAIAERVNQVQRQAAVAQAADSRRKQRQAIADAKAELDQAIKDAPIEREIQRLQEGLDRDSRRDDRRDLGRTLRDAQEELAAARRQAQTTGLTAEQKVSQQRFLRPFVEDVQDAKGEVKRFNTEGTIAGLQKRLDGQTDDIAENIGRLRDALADARAALVASQKSFATEGLVASLRSAAEEQKQAVTQGIADSIQAFNDGMITLPELNRRLAKLLSDNEVDYKTAGTKLGTAFVKGFEATLAGIGAQGLAILAGPQDPGAGLRVRPVAPAEEVQRTRDATAEARRNLDAALLKQGDDQTAVLRQIRDAVQRVPPKESAAEKAGRER